MPSVLLHIDETMDKRLRRAAGPGQKSRFILLANERALTAFDDRKTRAAYAKKPDTAPVWFDPRAWIPERWDDVSPPSRKRK